MVDLEERLQNRNYANWLRVTYGLKCVKDGLCTVTKRMMTQFQEEIKQQCKIDKACDNESCDSKNIKIEGLDKFCCPNNVCSELMQHIASEHINKKMIPWQNSKVREWPTDCWEIAKLYMQRGQPAANTGPASTDCTGLLQLISSCKQFKSKLSINPSVAEEVIKVRNRAMHSPELSLTDEFASSSMNIMLSFLSMMQQGITAAYKDIIDCEDAATYVKKLSETKLTVTMEAECLSDQISEIDTRFSCIVTTDAKSEVDLAHKQTSLLEKMVRDDSFLTSRLSNQLAVVNDKMCQFERAIENLQNQTSQTEHRVDKVETRLEELELRSSSSGCSFKNALQNYTQKLRMPMPEYNSIPQLKGGYLAEVKVCGGQVFRSVCVQVKRVDAEQDVAKLAFEQLQQQSDVSAAASDRAVDAVSNSPVSSLSSAASVASSAASASSSAASVASSTSAVSSHSSATVNACGDITAPVGTVQAKQVISKTSSYMSILEQHCMELKIDPPHVELSQDSATFIATASVYYGFTTTQSHAKKDEAKEGAASVALSRLEGATASSNKNCRTRLNEYCQLQRLGTPKYAPNDSTPFSCTVYIQLSATSKALPTDSEAKNDAARGILSRLGCATCVLQVFEDPRFETFSVSCSLPSQYELVARYRFAADGAGQTTKKTAEKIAAQHALSVLHPTMQAALDQCKNKLQEQYTQDKLPEYWTSAADDGLHYSEVSVTFSKQMTCDNPTTLEGSDGVAEHCLRQLGLTD